jgi:dolichol-phosphate mannosyltransferase
MVMEGSVVSFVVPVKDEEETIAELFGRIAQSVTELGRKFEVVFVDDGSTDGSWEGIKALASAHPEVRGIRFRRNLGKAAALNAGFKAARGDVVFTMDADLQDDPAEISRFLAKLDEGYDIVSGWKRVRHDPWHKVLPSRVFNAMLSKVSKTELYDHNCGFKCYRRQVLKEITLYGEMHRMVPALSTIRGFKSTEIAVMHHPRRFGRSKYGVKRFLRGFMDMLTVGFLQNYRERPLHLLGGSAFACAMVGILAVFAAFTPFLGGRSATLFGIVGGCLIAGSMALMGLGFLAELIVHALPPTRVSPPISEEVSFEAVLTVGPSLSLLEGGQEPREKAPSSTREKATPSTRDVTTVSVVA